MPEGFIHLTPPLELNAHQLRNALDFVNPDGAKDTDQLETNLCIQWRKEAVFEGENFPAGHYAWLEEYPEEGSILLDADKSTITHPVPKAQPEAEPVNNAFLTTPEMAAFNRFLETCEDGEGYDVPKSMMQRLAQIGVVRHLSRGIYSITEFGQSVIDPVPKAQPEGEPPISKDTLVELICEHTALTYHCARTWSAWGVGTMTQDDFEEVNESYLPDELADAILAKITTQPAPFTPITADMVTDEMVLNCYRHYPELIGNQGAIDTAKPHIVAAVNAWGAKK
jgi:hypothetical protein